VKDKDIKVKAVPGDYIGGGKTIKEFKSLAS
jgi:hypothetical protein